MAGHHEADAGRLVQTSRDMPHQVANHVIVLVLILACTVVCMQLQVVLAHHVVVLVMASTVVCMQLQVVLPDSIVL